MGGMRWAVALTATLLAGCGSGASDGDVDGTGGGKLIGEGDLPENLLEKAQLGDPHLGSAQRLAFGPGGVLLVGDGVRDRVIAIETGEGGFGVVPAPGSVFGLRAAVAHLYGEEVQAGEVVVQDVAVEPWSRRIYLAAERYHDGATEPLIAYFDDEGRLRRFSTDQVIWAAIRLPRADESGGILQGLSWIQSKVVAVVAGGAFMPSTVFVRETPIRHGDAAYSLQPATVLPSTGQSHADLPITAATGQVAEETGAWLATFVGAPVARFSLGSLEPGAADGVTVFDLGAGREARAVVAAADGTRSWLWMTVYNGAFDGRVLGYRVSGALAAGVYGVDAEAPSVIDFTGLPIHPDVVVEPALNDARRLALRSPDTVVALREDALEVVAFK